MGASSPTSCRRERGKVRSYRFPSAARGRGAWSSRSWTRRRWACGRSRSSASCTSCRATLVDLALWVADYYGSTPARALELVAPVRRQRRKEQAPPGERQSLEGEAAPDALSADQEARRRPDRRGRRAFCSTGRPAAARPRSTCSPRPGTRARARDDRARPGDRAHAADRRPLPARFGDSVALLHSGLTDAERRDERERIARGEARVVVGARSAIFAPMRDVGLICVDEEHDPSYKQESDPRYDARTVAAKRAALEGAAVVYGSATPRPESWAALERLELRERIGGEAAPGEDRRPAARGRLPALRAAARRAGRDRGARRQGDPAPQPPRDRAGPALPRLRDDLPLPGLRRLARAPPRRDDCAATIAATPSRAAGLSRLPVGRAGAHRRRTQRLERELARACRSSS